MVRLPIIGVVISTTSVQPAATVTVCPAAGGAGFQIALFDQFPELMQTDCALVWQKGLIIRKILKNKEAIEIAA